MILSIRQADRSDLPYVLELLAAMDGGPELPLEHGLRVFREMERYRNYACYLTWDGARPVGTFTLLVFPTLVHDGAFEALVDGVVVAPSRRGEGIGAAMMTEAMRLAAEAGCYKLMLSSNGKRAERASFLSLARLPPARNQLLDGHRSAG